VPGLKADTLPWPLFFISDPRLYFSPVYKEKQDMVGNLPVNQLQYPLIKAGLVQADRYDLNFRDCLEPLFCQLAK